VNGEYAAKVLDLRTYDSISKDIIKRWTHPIVLDNNLFCRTTYKYERHNIYKETKNLFLARSCLVEEDSVIGSGTSIGEKTIIKQSVIGRNCKIGRNCNISGSYLWEGCVIEDNVTMEMTICCDRVTVRSGAKLGKGTVLSYDVVIGKNFNVKDHTLLTTVKISGGEDDWNDTQTPKKAAQEATKVMEVGKDGKGFVYIDRDAKDVHSNSVACIPQIKDAWIEDQEEVGDSDEEEQKQDKKETDTEVNKKLERDISTDKTEEKKKILLLRFVKLYHVLCLKI